MADIESIRVFVAEHAAKLTGRVLDFGCGKEGTCRKPQPYRSLLPCGEYIGIDKGDPWPTGPLDGILCTQVMQYVGPVYVIENFARLLKLGGVLVMTYATNWPEVETDEKLHGMVDKWRFPKAGMEALLTSQGFKIETHEPRVSIDIPGFGSLVTGYGVVAVKP